MNSEEIHLEEDVDSMIASGPLPVIPNAQDLQVAAAAALSSFDSESESGSEESDASEDDFEQVQEDVVMNEFVSLNIKLGDKQGEDEQDAPHVCVELKSIQVESTAADQILDEESEETSSDEDEIDNISGDDEVEEIATYGELKSMLDKMTKECNDAAAPVPTAAELLFTESTNPIENIVINENDAVSLAGHVISRLEGTIVVKASKDSQVLDEGSILATKGKQLLGPVEDIFGPVQMPMYILRDPSALEGCGTVVVDIGDAVYSVDKLAKPVVEEELLRVKGYDSDDLEETDNKPDVECEFSDDEAEAAYRRSLKSKRKGTLNKMTSHNPKPPRRSGQTRQHQNRGQATAPPTSARPQYQPMYLADHPAMQNQYHFKQSEVNGHQNAFTPVTFETRHAFGGGGGTLQRPPPRHSGPNSVKPPPPPPPS